MYYFVLCIIFLEKKLDKSAKNKDEIPLNILNIVGYNQIMINNGSFLPTFNKVINIKIKYIVCKS